MKILKQMKLTYLFILTLLTIASTVAAVPYRKFDGLDEFQQPQPRKVKNGASYAEDVNSGKIKIDDFIGSPNRNVSASNGGCKITIKYSSPGVRGRAIWGKLVPYNKIWVTGANHATSISFDRDVRIDNRLIPAGTYAFFTIPGERDWVIIFNKNTDQHLADDYSKTDDVIRFNVKPTESPSIVQRLTYNIESIRDGEARINMVWEKRKISFVVKKN